MRITNFVPRACMCDVSATTRVSVLKRKVFVMVVSRPAGMVRSVLERFNVLAAWVTCDAGTVHKLASASPVTSWALAFT